MTENYRIKFRLKDHTSLDSSCIRQFATRLIAKPIHDLRQLNLHRQTHHPSHSTRDYPFPPPRKKRKTSFPVYMYICCESFKDFSCPKTLSASSRKSSQNGALCLQFCIDSRTPHFGHLGWFCEHQTRAPYLAKLDAHRTAPHQANKRSSSKRQFIS